MVRSADPRLKPDERRRPTLQRAHDYILSVARTDTPTSSPNNFKASKTTSQENPPEVDKSCQTDSDSRRPPRPSRGSPVPNIRQEEKPASPAPATETFTHLRRNAVSDGIPYGDYRYLTGSRSEYECLQDANNRQQKAPPYPFSYRGQERGARGRNVSTETVWNGESGGAVEDVDEKADGNSGVEKDLRKEKERRSSGLEEKGAKRQG